MLLAKTLGQLVVLGMYGKPPAYNTYATMPTIDFLFMGFSCSQNVNKEIIGCSNRIKRFTNPGKTKFSGVFSALHYFISVDPKY